MCIGEFSAAQNNEEPYNAILFETGLSGKELNWQERGQ